MKVFGGQRSWWEPFDLATVAVERIDPLANQIAHFVEVIRDEAAPICCGRDGLKTLMVIEAVSRRPGPVPRSRSTEYTSRGCHEHDP